MCFEGWNCCWHWGQDFCMDIPSSRYICYMLLVIDVLFCHSDIKLLQSLTFLSWNNVVKIRKWRVHSNSSLRKWPKVWTTFWFFSRQGESGARWPPNSHSLDVSIQCWKGWRNHLSKFSGMAVALPLQYAFVFREKTELYFLFVANCDNVVFCSLNLEKRMTAGLIVLERVMQVDICYRLIFMSIYHE